MNILISIPYFIPAWSFGGPLQVAFLQAKYLAKRGHKVTVITSDIIDYSNRNQLLSEQVVGINIIRFPSLSLSLIKKFNFHYLLGLDKWLKNNLPNYDIVHLHDFFLPQNITFQKYCRKYQIPYYIQPHGSAVPLVQRKKTFIKKIFNYFYGKNLINDSQKIIAVTQEEVKNIIKYFSIKPSKMSIIPNGVEKPIIKKNIFRQKYNVPTNNTIITSIGRLHPIKGFDLLINSFSLYIKKHPNSTLVIAGPDEGQLNQLTKIVINHKLNDKIIFTGLITSTDKSNLLSDTNIFALFSRDEPFPMAILEAASYKIPIVISKFINISKLINKYQIGQVTNPYNFVKSADSFNKVLNHKTYIFSKFNKTYQIDNTVKQLESIYLKHE